MMVLRLLALVLVFAAASWATPAAHAQSDGSTNDGSAQVEPEEPEPIPDFWTEEEPASGSATKEPDGPASSPPDKTSTSPGGTEPASGTTTTGPGAPVSTSVAPAQAGTGTETETESGPACDPRLALRRALKSLRSALRGRDLLDRRTPAVKVRVSPCVPGTFELAVVLEGADTVLWRARRDLKTTQRATLRLTLTRAGRRFIARASRGPARTVHMKLRARLTP